MTIKSDKWIRKMAAEHAMIEPFQEDQIRYSEDNSRLISYGLSSYGYDVRCANEFKVFTNIHSAIVDPKAFFINYFDSLDLCFSYWYFILFKLYVCEIFNRKIFKNV